MSNGKGSKPRPLSVKREDYEANWARIFGKKPCTTTTQTKKNTKIR